MERIDPAEIPQGGFNRLLGLEYVEVHPDRVVARIEVDERHRQPYGIVHGGVYASLVESVASVGAAVWAHGQGISGVVGLANATDFLQFHREGPIVGVATPVHRGRRLQLWQVEVSREDDGKILARGQVRLLHLHDPAEIGASEFLSR